MNRYIPFLVYENIQKLIEYRNIKTNYKFLNNNAFIKEISLFDYIMIPGTNSRTNKTIYIVLFTPNSIILNKSNDFKNFFKNKIPTKEADSLEILFISSSPPATMVCGLIDGLRDKYPNLYVETHVYDKFVIVVPEHVSVPKHKFATKEEIAQLTDVFYKDKKNFPKMLLNDSMAIWMGARVGDIVKIKRISENSGKSIAYRLVVDA